jgi:hypothetical protein
MRRRLDELSENATALGQAGINLARAEVTALSGELRLSGRKLLRIVLLVAAGLFILFWAVAVLVFVGIEVGTLWIPRWGSALVVLAILLLLTGLVAAGVRRRLRHLETPAATFRRRLEDHLEWWRRVVDRDS